MRFSVLVENVKELGGRKVENQGGSIKINRVRFFLVESVLRRREPSARSLNCFGYPCACKRTILEPCVQDWRDDGDVA